MLMAFLAGSTLAMGQDTKEKKIERLQRKIEKQTKKLQELTGEETHGLATFNSPFNSVQIEKITAEAREQAERAREQVAESRGKIREEVRVSMDRQREAMDDQREAMKEQKKQLEQQMIVIRKDHLDKLENLNDLDSDKLKERKESEIIIDKNINGKKYHYYYKTPKFAYKSGEPLVIASPDMVVESTDPKALVFSTSKGNQDNLSINKNLTDESSAADFNYEVKQGVGSMLVLVNGAIDSGKVKIIIKRPDGEVYNEYTLSSLANVNWKQTVKFEDMKEADYVGKWTVSVAAEKAKGNYSVELSGR